MTLLEVVRAGARLLVQDGGRPGRASQGVGASGFADPTSARLANRLVGNAEDEALLESLLGDLVLRARNRSVTVAVTGGTCALVLGVPGAPDRVVDAFGPIGVPPGAGLRIGPVTAGLLVHVAVHGGVDVAPVLGSRSTDTLSGLGPSPLQNGDVVAIGERATGWPLVDAVPPEAGTPVAGPVVLPFVPGPHDDRLAPGSLDRLLGDRWTVSPRADRVGVSLAGATTLELLGPATVPSFGTMRGAIEVPPDGSPIVLMADHPTTVGYPVIGVVDGRATHALAQARPGTPVRFVRSAIPPHLPLDPRPPRTH